MTTNWKRLALVSSTALGLLIVLAIIGAFVAYNRFIAPEAPTNLAVPQELTTAGVLLGKDVLAKSTYVQDARLGTVSEIAIGTLDPKQGHRIVIVGSKGALFLDGSAQPQSFVLFSVHASHVNILDVDGNGIFEFVDRGGGWQDVSLMDHKGNAIWTYGGIPGVDDLAAGDLDGNGILDFVVGFNGSGGVRLLDRAAKEIWKQPDGNVWHVELADADADGKPEIIHSNAEGKMTVRDGDGKAIRSMKLGPYFSFFSLARWPDKKSAQYALFAEDNVIWLFDFFGKSVAQFAAPASGSLGDARGVPFRIRIDHPEYFASVVAFANWDKSVLYVHGPTKNLVYQEIIPEECPSITSIPSETGIKEDLLVGCDQTVFRYSGIAQPSKLQSTPE
ncbi:MAG: FG-GAP repeat domain-containing protein [Burkholderiales bacterium]